MTSGEKSGYDVALSAHSTLIGQPPVSPNDIIGSLQAIKKAGEKEVATDSLGAVRFANEITTHYAGALALNVAGIIQPPFNQKQVQSIETEMSSLTVITQGNGDTGNGPTDTNKIPTSGKK